jgi:hypothetical protein
MRTLRPVIAADPKLFGRAALRFFDDAPRADRRWGFSDDLWLFATTFAAGFVFVSILIG